MMYIYIPLHHWYWQSARITNSIISR
jgi:hypothetical protein